MIISLFDNVSHGLPGNLAGPILTIAQVGVGKGMLDVMLEFCSIQLLAA